MTIRVLQSISDVGGGRAAWLVDVWGVMHNGVAPYLDAAHACEMFRGEGGTVLLLSNAPRPADDVARQLGRIGVPADAYDAILTSGDAARALVARAAAAGHRVGHLGPDRDLGLYNGLVEDLVPVETAATVVCTGLLDDERETAATYGPLLAHLAREGADMICANPDIAVERAGRVIPCAGALARAYEELGGKVAYAGKPHRPIYDLALERLAGLRGTEVAAADVLAIGDGVKTDILGAAGVGIDAVYIASRVHLEPGEALDGDALERLFPAGGPRPIAAMAKLAW